MFSRKSRTVTKIFTAVAVLLALSFATTHASSTPRGSQATRQSSLAFAPEVVTITASKTDTLANDVNGNTLVDPGDTLEYAIVVSNSGDENALDTLFTDITDDTETTFVAGSLTATPMAVNDAYNVIGNTAINHLAATGLLTNDIDPDGGALTASCAPCTTAQGATVSLNANGSFSYTPPAGFTGTDTFTYTVTDPDSLTDTGTVTFTVSNMIWWVNNTAVAGNGTSTSPFNSLTPVNGAGGAGDADSSGDTIFVYQGAGNYTTGLQLEASQRLCGQGVSLQTCSGLTPPTGTTFPSVTGNPTITNATADGILLSTNNTIQGINVGDKPNGTGIIGTNFGTLNVSTVSVSGTGAALNLNTGTLNSTFTSLASTSTVGGRRGINLESIAAGSTFTSNATSISGSSAEAIRLNSNNSGATFTFTGLTISSGTQTGFLANNGGTLAITGATNTLASTSGTALNLTNTTIGASGLTFQSISSNGGSNTGIILDTTGSSGGLTVTGTGTAASGGTIANKTGVNGSTTTGIGIYLNNTQNVSLTRMQLNDFQNFAIRGFAVVNFTLDNTVVNGVNGTDAVQNEGSISFGAGTGEPGGARNGLTGTATVTNSNISGGFEDNFRVKNQSGSLNRLTFTNTTIGANSTANGNDAVLISGESTAILNITVQNSFFTSARGDLFNLTLSDNSSSDLSLTGNAFSNNHPGIATGGGGVTIVSGNNIGAGATLTFNLSNNSFRDSVGVAVLIVKSTDPGTVTGTFANNTIGIAGTANSGSLEGSALKLQNAGLGTFTASITGNQIYQYNNFGIELLTGGGASATGGNLNATITGNTIANPGTNPATAAIAKNGIHLNAGTMPGDTYLICLNIGGTGALENTITGSGAPNDTGAGGEDFRLRQRQATTVRLPGYGGANNDNAAVVAYVQGRNVGTPTGIASNSVPTGGGFVNTPGGVPCAFPPAAEPEPNTSTDSNATEATIDSVVDTAVNPSLPTFTNDTAPKNEVNPKLAVTESQKSVSSPRAALFAPEATTTVGPFTLPPQESTTITFQVTVNDPFPAANNPICNQATISGSNFGDVLTDDPDTGAADDPTCTTVNISADLSITKTDGATTEIPGTSISYTIVASNAGPSPDPAAVVADTFPATITGITWTCVGAGGATCVASGSGNINETVNLPVGGSVTFTASGTISAAATGTLVNTATVATSTGITDPDPDNNSATDSNTLTPQADVSITKTDGQTSDIPGTSISYTIVASNAGPSNAPSVTIADTFPATLTGVTWTCAGAGGGVCTASGSGNINDTANLPAGGSVTYTVNATIAASATGTLSNTATAAVGGGVTDPTPGNNSATDNTTLTPQANLGITKTDGATTEIPGTSVTYTIVASNPGPSNDPVTTVADTFPAILSSVTWTCVGAGGATCTAAGSGNINDTVNLPAGGSVTYTAVGNISAAATGTLVNTATVTASITDPTPGNNSATDTNTLTPQADVSITKTDGQTSDIPGTTIIYTIVASNAGPSNAPSVTIADTFPATLNGITWTCVGVGGGTCTAAGSGNINDTANLPAGGSVTYTVNATIAASATGTLSNTATATVGVTDPTPGNNSATDNTTLTPQADLAITKTDGQTTAVPGQPIVYTIVASNAGPSSAANATVADTFPATLSGVTWTCVGAGGATCTASGSGNINDTVNLPAGGSVTYTASGLIDSGATGTLANTATISAPGGVTDPDPANNSATDSDTLVPTADLAITKTDGLTAANPGQSTTYTITVSNAGPSNALNAAVADTFPAALTPPITWTCSGTLGGTCTTAGTGDIADSVTLPSGAAVTYIIAATIDAGASGTLVNTATVTAPGGVTDPDTSNNSATDSTTLDAPPVITDFTITPGTIDENDSVNLSVTFTDPNTPETHEVVIDWGDGNSETVNLPIGILTASATHQYLDDNPSGTSADNYTVSVTVNEADGGTDSDTAVVTVNNLAPTLSGISATNVDENGSTTLSGTIGDIGSQDTFALTVDWGDGNSDTYTYGAGTAAFSETHQYLDDNPTGTPADNYTITLTLTDDDTGSAPDSDTITVSNIAPTLSNVSATATINENGSISLSGDITDPGTQDTFTLNVDWGDGNSETFSYGAGTAVFTETHQYLDDNPTGTPADNYTISLTLTDDDTGSDTDSDTITVNNVAPSLTNLAATPLIITETDTITLTGNIVDIGTQDTFTRTVDWADGNVETVTYPAGTTAFTVTHTYQDDGLRLLETVLADFFINVTLEDDDTGSDSESVLVTVNNEPPTLSNIAISSPVNEGDSATLTGSISDLSPNDSFTLVVDWGDGITETFGYGAGTTNFSETHLYVDDNPTGTPSDVYTVSLTLTDDNGGSDTDSTAVTVNNVAPTLSNVSGTAVDENGSTTLSGNISDPGTADTFTLLVDWGDGITETFSYGAGTAVFTETHTYPDDDPTGTPSDTYTVGLTLTDDDTGSATDSTTITVSNVAPVLSNLTATAVNENGTSTLSGNITDPGTQDTFDVVVDWGDGITETLSYGAGTTTFSETHQYLDDDPSGTPSDDYTVSVAITDDDTGMDSETAVLTVTNLAPDLFNVTATPLNIDENNTITVTGQISDVGTLDSFTLVIDWADGISETLTYPAGTVNFLATHTYVDDGLSLLLTDFTIGLTLTDDDTGSDSETVTVQVDNVPPTLSNVAISDPIDEGDTAALTGNIGEVSPADTFTLTVAWGDGNVDRYGYGTGTTSFNESHVYVDDDPTGTPADIYTVTMTLVDDNGGTAVHVTNLTVHNVTPQLGSVAVTSAVAENGSATLTGNFTDPGLADTFTLAIDWGDGNSDTVTTFGAGNSFTITHQYQDDDPSGTPADLYTVNLTLTDDDTGSDSDTASLTVNNVAPVVDAGVDVSAAANTAVTFNGSFTDVGTLDTHTFEWDFGDGNTASGSLTPAHTYTAQGIYTVTLTVTDDDTGTTSDQLVVTVVGGKVYLPIIMAAGSTTAAPDLVVSSLTATADNVVITVTNEGNVPVTESFWVDVYINPNPIPTMVNQTWQFLADEGLVWGVTGITLNPGQSLTLSINGDHYRADLSEFSGNMVVGTPVYAQVDSANSATTYGNVLEDHEISGGAYNNIAGTTVQ